MHDEATVRRLPLRGGPLAAVETLVSERGYGRGRHIVRQGEPCGRLFLVGSGVVRESAVSPEGREAVLGLRGPGEVFGRLPPLVVVPAPFGARAMTDCRILSLGPIELRALLVQRPAVGAELLAAVAERGRRLARAFERVLWHDVQGRVAAVLDELAAEYGRPQEAGVAIDLPLTQEDLAAMVGSTRESANRAVAGLIATRRLRLDHRRYVVLSPDEGVP